MQETGAIDHPRTDVSAVEFEASAAAVETKRPINNWHMQRVCFYVLMPVIIIASIVGICLSV